MDKTSYFQPIIEYVKATDRQGVFFERPTERIHHPDPAYTYMKVDMMRMMMISDNGVSGLNSMDKFLVTAYSQQAREVNGGTGEDGTFGRLSQAVKTKLN